MPVWVGGGKERRRGRKMFSAGAAGRGRRSGSHMLIRHLDMQISSSGTTSDLQIEIKESSTYAWQVDFGACQA